MNLSGLDFAAAFDAMVTTVKFEHLKISVLKFSNHSLTRLGITSDMAKKYGRTALEIEWRGKGEPALISDLIEICDHIKVGDVLKQREDLVCYGDHFGSMSSLYIYGNIREAIEFLGQRGLAQSETKKLMDAVNKEMALQAGLLSRIKVRRPNASQAVVRHGVVNG